MSQSLSILMAQINPAVGAIDANKSKIIDIIKADNYEYISEKKQDIIRLIEILEERIKSKK